MKHRSTNRSLRTALGAALVAGLGSMLLASGPVSGDQTTGRTGGPAKATVALKSPAAFAKIKNRARRSRALFTEAGKVLMHSRCVNCHPSGDSPRQRNGITHQPPVVRGKDGFGVIGMRCGACHQDSNFAPGRIPGAPKWHLAPREMAWEGKSLKDICTQIKDPKRNGGRTLQAIVEHMGHDKIVGWAWSPGADREPAPGDWKTFAALIAAWAETGAQCPTR